LKLCKYLSVNRVHQQYYCAKSAIEEYIWKKNRVNSA
jgi:hypothetical protein